MASVRNVQEYPIDARYIAHEIPITDAPPFLGVSPEYLRRDVILYRLQNRKAVYVFSFGAITFIGVDDRIKERFIGQFTAKIPLRMYPRPAREAYLVTVGDTEKTTVGFNELHLRAYSAEAMSIIAQVMAQSASMEYYERLAGRILDSFAPINAELARHGKLSISHRDVHRVIGKNNVIIQEIITKLHILDWPDIIWEDEEMEALYNRLHTMFELSDRFETIEYKLKFVQDNSEVILDSLQGRREVGLEIIVVILIVIEILLFVYEIFA